MAQIDLSKIMGVNKSRNIVHEKVICTYTIFESEGEKYVQLDTYGRIDREMPEKASQSLQFDKKSAQFIVDLLAEEFNVEISKKDNKKGLLNRI